MSTVTVPSDRRSERLRQVARHVRPDAQSYLTIVVFSGLASGLSFITSVIVARRLGPAEFGRFAIFYSVFQVTLTATNFGDAAYVRFANTKTDEDDRPFLRAALVVEVGVALLLAVAAYPLATFVAGGVLGHGRYQSAVLAGIVVGASLNLLSLLAATYQARQRYLGYASLSTLFYVLVLAGILAVVGAGLRLSLRTVLVFYLGAAALTLVVSAARLVHIARPMRVEGDALRRLLSYSRFIVGSNVAYLLYQRMDVVFVAHYGSAASVGQYGVALRLAVLATLFTGSLAPFFLPKAARTRGAADEVSDYVRMSLVLAAPIVVFVAVLWLCVPALTTLLFGEAYGPAAGLTRVLLVAPVCIAIYTPLSQLFLTDDRPTSTLHMALVKLVATAGLLVVLARSAGAAGAAWAVAGSEVVTMLFVLAAVRARLTSAARQVPV
jgi:O-antigen/teichoic acid export membrane protein